MNNTTNYTTKLVSFRKSRLSSNSFMADEVTLYIYSITLVLGIIGNSLVVFSILSRRRRRRMTANDVFILNLAVSDLSLLLFFIPYAMYIRLAPFHATFFICKFTAPTITVALGGMVYTLTAVAVQRCIAITQPFRQECSVKRAGFIVIIIWVVSIVLSIPKIVVATPINNKICLSMWKSQTQFKIYTTTLFVLRFAIPFCVIIAAYAKMGIVLLSTHAPRFATDSKGNIRDITNRKENIEVVKTLIVVSALFFILMLPYRVTRLMTIYGEKNPLLRNINQLLATLVIAHSCINPLIYGALMKKFSQDYLRCLKDVFCCRLCNGYGSEDDSSLERFELEEGASASVNGTKNSRNNKTVEETMDFEKSTQCEKAFL